MSDLSREARQALQAFREEERPTSSQREHIWSEIDAGAADGRREPTGPRSGSTLRRWLTITLAAAAVALLAFSWLRGRIASERNADSAAMGAPYEATTSTRPTPVQPRSPRSVTPATPDAVKPPTVPADLVQPGAKPEPPRAAPPEQSPTDSLAAEQQLIGAARAALEDRDGAGRAFELLERHRRDFPEGQLAEEASIVRARVLCELGRLDASRTEVRRFLDTWPDSQHRSRMLRVCVQRPSGH